MQKPPKEKHLPCNAQQLTERAAKGDPEVLDELVECYQRALLHFARRRCRNNEDAADVVQDAYEAATRHLEGFRGQASIKTWLTRLVISACSRKKRGLRNNPRIHVSLEDIGSRREVRPHTRPQAESTAAIKEAFEHIETALNQLNATDRAVLLLRDGKELSTAETARVLDLTVPAVKSRLHRARKSIRQLVESAFDASEAA